MKNITILFVLVNLGITTSAQITIQNNPEPIIKENEVVSIVPYDSLQSIFLTEDTLQNQKFIGQKLFLPNNSNGGDYYTISSINNSGGTPILRLRNDVSNVISDYETRFEHSYIYNSVYLIQNYISVGYFTKVKQLYEGKKMVWYVNITDQKYYTGWDDLSNPITYPEYSEKDFGTIFNCTAIKLFKHDDEKEYRIVAVLKNDKGLIIVECPRDLSKVNYLGYYGLGFDSEFSEYIKPKLHTNICGLVLVDDVKTIESDKMYIAYKQRIAKNELENNPEYQANQYLKDCIAKYGQKNGTLISKGLVAIGMTKKMCEAAGLKCKTTVTTNQGKSEVWTAGSIRADLVNGIVTRVITY